MASAKSKMNVRPGIGLVMRREIRRIARRPALAFFVFVFPLLVFVTLGSIFRLGVPTDLPLAVVDNDRSELSRQIVRTVDAMPEVEVVQRPEALQAARHLMFSGSVYGVLYIPREFERDMRAGRQPEVAIFYNNQFMTPGSVVARSVQTALGGISTGISVSQRLASGQAVSLALESANPVPVQQSPLFNPTLDYAHFLLAALLPAALQIFIGAASANAIAGERQRAGGLATLSRLGGGIVPALLGKFIPYTVIFATVLAAGDALLISAYEAPFLGNVPLYLVSSLIFIIAYQAVGIVFGLFMPTLAAALGGVGIFTAPAFGFVGVSFPRLAMGGFAVFWSSLLPLTWYLEVRIDQMLRAAPLDLSASAFATLAVSAAGYGLAAAVLVWLRVRQANRLSSPGGAA